MTAKGRRALKRADSLMEACELNFVATLRDEERTQLRDMLERLLAANREK